jgi:hypothetical protein
MDEMKIAGLIFAACLCASVAHSQALPAGTSPDAARYLVDFQIGSASGLGYHLPDLSFGATVEKPVGTRWEAQGEVKYSPDRKYITNDGNEAQIGAMGLFWLNQTLALSFQARFSRLWTSQFKKTDFYPSAGVVLRDRWFGLPGRAYFDYVFPTGCQWATASNPCVIQSNRTSGIEGFQEFRQYGHWRVGIRAAWVNFANQGNPNDRAAGRVWNNTATVDAEIRYEFSRGSLDAAY